MSSLTDVRDKIVSTISGIAQSGLGFDNAGGNVHEYLYDYEQDEKKSSYLSAEVGSRKVCRAWGVQVTSSIEPYSTGNVYLHSFTVTIEGYYRVAERNTLIDHAELIKDALQAIYPDLDGVVDVASAVSDLTLTIAEGQTESSEMVVGSMTLTAELRKTGSS